MALLPLPLAKHNGPALTSNRRLSSFFLLPSRPLVDCVLRALCGPFLPFRLSTLPFARCTFDFYAHHTAGTLTRIKPDFVEWPDTHPQHNSFSTPRHLSHFPPPLLPTASV